MSKKPTNCAYCGKPDENLTLDHIVPESFWPEGTLPAYFITVPACKPCHKPSDSDASLFRALAVLEADPQCHPSIEVLAKDKVARSILHDKDLRKELLTDPKFTWVVSESGQLKISGVDVEIKFSRFRRTIDKIVRGLFYHVTKSPLPETHLVDVIPAIAQDFRTAAGIR